MVRGRPARDHMRYPVGGGRENGGKADSCVNAEDNENAARNRGLTNLARVASPTPGRRPRRSRPLMPSLARSQIRITRRPSCPVTGSPASGQMRPTASCRPPSHRRRPGGPRARPSSLGTGGRSSHWTRARTAPTATRSRALILSRLPILSRVPILSRALTLSPPVTVSRTATDSRDLVSNLRAGCGSRAFRRRLAKAKVRVRVTAGARASLGVTARTRARVSPGVTARTRARVSPGVTARTRATVRVAVPARAGATVAAAGTVRTPDTNTGVSRATDHRARPAPAAAARLSPIGPTTSKASAPGPSRPPTTPRDRSRPLTTRVRPAIPTGPLGSSRPRRGRRAVRSGSAICNGRRHRPRFRRAANCRRLPLLLSLASSKAVIRRLRPTSRQASCRRSLCPPVHSGQDRVRPCCDSRPT